MRDGVPVVGNAFYDALCRDADFCRELGHAVLAGSKLETRLSEYLSANGVPGVSKKATLGALVRNAQSSGLLSRWIPALEELKVQRNYFIHGIHPLFAGAIEETIFARENLLDSDIDILTDAARQLAENLEGLAEALERIIHAPN